MKVLILLFSLVKVLSAQDDGVLCSARTCSDYISENPCSSLPDQCNIQNATQSGLFLPSPDPCNCCQYCLVNLNEGDYCAKGEIGGSIPESICGPGLTCGGIGDDPVCVKMTDAVSSADIDQTLYPCSRAQAAYDTRRQTATVGFLETRPDCDDDGFFQPYKCVLGQTCFCVDKQGNRIFGEIPYSSTAHLNLKCECSRKFNDILKFFDRDLRPNEFFRCASNGDYDTIQCIGDECMCTDILDGAPTFPTQAGVNMSLISSTTLPDCFNKKIHETRKYYHACAENYLKIWEEVQAYKNDGYDTVFEIEYPQCDLEGNYAAVQKDETIDPPSYYCATSNGAKIDQYQSSDDTGMDCNCARSRLLMQEDAKEKPECCGNGNFNPVQCRRGTCYCVDSNGYQDVNNSDNTKKIEASVYEKTTLFCYDDDEQQKCAASSTPSPAR